MSPEFSQITTFLTQSSADRPRQLVIVQGDAVPQHNLISLLLTSLGDSALCFSDASDFEHQAGLHSLKKAITVLGQEKPLVILDCRLQLEADALAAVSGVVTGGGWLVLCLPAQQNWPAYADSLFKQRFIDFLESAVTAGTAVVIDANTSPVEQLNAFVKQQAADVDGSNISRQTSIRLTADQQSVIETITDIAQAPHQACVIVSDRGRGKSSVLGMAAAKLMQSGNCQIVLTAPRLKACEKVFEHACRELRAELVRAGVCFQQSQLQFIAPDELCRAEQPADDEARLLLVDEAASIPVPMLKQLLEKFPRSVFATTVHGYEGTGRGFAIRFYHELNHMRPGWRKVEMKTPVRWPENDPLEQWLFQFLCLDAELPEVPADISAGQLSYRQIMQQELATDEVLLRDVFACLVLAHYRTRPSDLKRLLDDAVVITIAAYQQHIVGVVLSADEGGFGAELTEQIYQGQRRPAGHLLAQNLTYHCGCRTAGSLISHRIMRIVVHPSLQAIGIGTSLIQQVIAQARSRPVDLIGASFGVTRSLLNFWQQNGFELVRIGFTREQTSNEHAGLLVQGLTEAGRQATSFVKERFQSHWPYLADTVLSDMKIVLPELNVRVQPAELSEQDLQEVASFVHYSRAYELCIAGLNKWLWRHQADWQQDEFAESYRLVISAVLEQQDWKTIAEQRKLTGKNQARQLFKEAVTALWQSLNHS